MARVRFIADLLSRWRSGFFSKRAAHLRLGERGEKWAARFLRKRGFKILYRNYRAKHGGEVDIVCRDGEALVFVEVKTRSESSVRFGDPLDAVNRDKQQLIIRGALAWLRLLDFPKIMTRFDVVEIVVSDGKPRCNLISDAFQMPERVRY